MSRLAIAQQLIQDQEYKTAALLLEKEEGDIGVYRTLSYLYRLHDRYEKEESLVKRALQQFPGDSYLQERQKWHALPAFDRMVARQPLHLPFNIKHIPSPDVVQQLCFVTMGSKDNFQWTVETLESLKATRKYAQTPIVVMDVGFTDEQKDYLEKIFGIYQFVPVVERMKDILDFRLMGMDPNNMSTKDIYIIACNAYPYLGRLIPDEFRYYFFIESDIWIQDDRFIDLYIWLCEKQGFAKGCYNDGLCCGDKHSRFFKVWQEIYLEGFKQDPQNVGPYTQERANEFAHQRLGLQYASVFDPNIQHNGFLFCWAIPVISPHNTMLMDARFYQPMSTIHVASQCEFVRKTGRGYFPTQVLPGPLNQQQFDAYLKYSQQLLKDGFDPNQFPEDTAWISLRYRVWPWADKPEIKKALYKEALCQDV